MKLSQFKFTFPKTMIAKSPKTPRDMCKLMVIDKETREIKSQKFKNVIDYMNEGDVLVLNDSKVFPARLYGNKEKTKAKIEVFLLDSFLNQKIYGMLLLTPQEKFVLVIEFFWIRMSFVKLSIIQLPGVE